MAWKWKLYWLIFALTLGVYLVMVLWSLPHIAGLAGGLTPFDMRLGGYSLAEAKSFLAALPPEGVDFYLNVQHLLDMAYPAMLAVVLGIGALGLATGRAVWIGVLAAIAAMIGAAFDYLENAAVKGLLLVGADEVTANAVEQASRWTLLKSGLTTVAMTLVLILLIGVVFRRWRGRQR
ncbi:MAG: hypothetical protein KDA67_12335 [Rhodobacteraceae bacterium]|nr:hypothetical protein [Paracoccaceae bacterium]